MEPVSYSVTPDPEKIRAAWDAVPAGGKNVIRYNFGRYLGYLVQYIKREKLSGQVLGKHTGRYSLIGGKAMFARGNPRWEMKTPGFLKANIKAQTKPGSDGEAAEILEPRYGAAWETGFDRKAYTVSAKHLTRDGGFGFLTFYAGGAWRFAQQVSIPAQHFDARPHVKPSVFETRDRFVGMVLRPLVRIFVDASRGIRQVGDRV